MTITVLRPPRKTVTLLRESLGVSEGGGPGALTVETKQFLYSQSGLATGYAPIAMAAGDHLYDARLKIVTAFDGFTPKADFFGSLWGTSKMGFINSAYGGTANSPGLIEMWQADADMPNIPGVNTNGLQVASLKSAMLQASLAMGTPMPDWWEFSSSCNFGVTVSQDGSGLAFAGAFITATTAVTIPFTVTLNSNDKLIFTGTDSHLGGGQRAPEQFQVTAGTYSSLGALETAIMAAAGTASDTFGQYVTVTDNGSGKLVFTLNKAGGAGNGSNIGPPNHDITGITTGSGGLGFTSANADFQNGVGGAPQGSSIGTVGTAILSVIKSTPVAL